MWIFSRLLKAGMAKVYDSPHHSHASVTHVMAKPITEDSKSHNAPCFPVSHIVQHLFGVSVRAHTLQIVTKQIENSQTF